jgi:hypothetical protein
MKRWLVPILAVLIVAAGVGGFFGGRATAGGSTTEAGPQTAAQAGMNGTGTGQRPSGTGTGTGTRGGFTTGTILSKDDTSLTIKLSDGNSRIVYLSDSTTISETKDATVDVLTTGEDVTVIGSSNSDGSVTATSVMVGSSGLGGLPGGAPGANGTTGTGGTPPSGMPADGNTPPADGSAPAGSASAGSDAGTTATTAAQ